MAIDAEFLEILVCPETKEPLREADPVTVSHLNELIESDNLVDRSGEKISLKIEGGLVPRSGGRLYPIREGIPILLVESSINLRSATLGTDVVPF